MLCVNGTCGSRRGACQPVPLEVEAFIGSPTMGLKSRFKFKSCAARHKDLKRKGEGKELCDVGPVPQLRFLTHLQLVLYPPLRMKTMLPHSRSQRGRVSNNAVNQ